jgi:hypothetical protein
MRAGDTLIIERPGTSLDSHLWIVISDPSVDADKVVIVNMTSWRADKDQACILNVGDHSFVIHRTCVSYEDAKILTTENLEKLITSGLIQSRGTCSGELLQRIRKGVPNSRMKLGTVDVLEEQGVIEPV